MGADDMTIKQTPSRCPECSTTRHYVRKYDAYACKLCNVWLEGKCKDTACSFCTVRPESPL